MANLTYPYFSSFDTNIGWDNAAVTYMPFYPQTVDNATIGVNADEADANGIFPEACSVAGFSIKCLTAPGAGKSWTFRLRKNGIDTSLVLVLSDTNTTVQDLTTIITFVAGDKVSYSITPSGTPTYPGQLQTMILLNSVNLILMGGTIRGPLTGVTYPFIASLMGNMINTGTFLNVNSGIIFPTNGSLKNFYFNLDNTPTAGTTRICKLYQNTVQQVSATFVAGDTLATDLTSLISVVSGDDLIYGFTKTGSPPATESCWSCSFVPSDGSAWFPYLGTVEFFSANPNTIRNGIPATYQLNDSSNAITTSGGQVGKCYAFGKTSFKQLYFYAYDYLFFSGQHVAPGVGTSLRVALSKDVATETALTNTLSDTTIVGSDITNQVQLPTGSYFFWRVTGISSPYAAYDVGFMISALVRWDGFDPFIPCQDDGSNHRFRLDYILDTQRPAQDALNDMLATCSGFLVYAGSKVKLRIEKPETITQYFGDGSTTDANASFDPGNIVKDSFSWSMPSIDARPNRIRVQWVDPDQNYVKVYTQVDDRIDQDDRNTVITKDVSLLGITRASQASRMAKFLMASMKYASINIEFSARLDSIHCEIGDVICVTHQSAKFTRKQFRITNMQEADNETIRFSCKEYNPSLYDDHVGAGPIQMVVPAFSNPYAIPPDPTNITLTEVGFQLADGTHITNINVAWTAVPADTLLNLNYYLLQVSFDQGVTWGDAGIADRNSTSFRITVGNAPNGTVVKVRVRAVSVKGIVSAGNNTATITLLGNVSPPSDVSSLTGVFSIDHVALSWPQISDPDLFGYEIRQGDTNSTWETGSVVVTGYGGTNYNIFNVVAGTKKYCIKAIDRSGNYSSTAACTSVTATAGAGSNVIFEFDLFSRITDFPHPLLGTLSANLNLVPTVDYNPAYYRQTIQPKTNNTWASLQTNYATWLAIQNSGLRFGFDPFVTSQESYTTDIIDLLTSLTGTFIMDIQTYATNNQTPLIIQYSTSTDGITFTSFANFINGTYTMRYVKFKFLIQAKTSSTIIRLIYAKLTVTSP